MYVLCSDGTDVLVMMMQEAMRLHGLSGPVKIAGTPGQWGSVVTFEYWAEAVEDTAVVVELAFGMVDGSMLTSPLYLKGKIQQCRIEMQGFQYVDFGGVRVLAPMVLSQSEMLESSDAFGAARDRSAQGKISDPFASGSKACIDYRESLSGKHSGVEYVVGGMHLSYVGLCDAHAAECTSPYAVDVLVRQMLRMIDLIAKTLKLSYTLACESLLYGSGKQSQPPLYGCVVINADQKSQWQSGFDRMQAMSSYVVEAGTEGDGFVHVRYSRFSDVRVIVWAAPVGVTLKAASSNYPVAKAQNIPDPSARTFDGLASLCDQCSYCSRKRPSVTFGGLMNAGTRFCAEASQNASQVSFKSCKFKGGDQHVVPLPDLQLSIGAKCLSASSSARGLNLTLFDLISLVLDFAVELVECGNTTTPSPASLWSFENNRRYIRHLGCFVIFRCGRLREIRNKSLSRRL